MDAKQVIEGLRRRYPPSKGWITLPEVRLATGWSVLQLDGDIYNGEQRIDLFALNTWKSNGFERIAFEVKVSRSDFLNEIKDPGKRAGAEALSHRFYFATPAGLVDVREIPDGCGLLEVHESGVTREAKAATRRDAPRLPIEFTASLLRVASEQRTVDRCGSNGCNGSTARHRWSGHQAYRGVRIPLCSQHAEQWDDHHRELEQAAETA